MYFFIRNKLKNIYTSQSNSCKHLSHYLYFHGKWKITRFHSPTNLTTSRVGSGNFSPSSHGKYRELIKQAIGVTLYKHQIFPNAINITELPKQGLNIGFMLLCLFKIRSISFHLKDFPFTIKMSNKTKNTHLV